MQVAPRLSQAALWSLVSVFVTNIGDGVYTLTVGKILYDKTGTAAAFGLVVVLEYVINFCLQIFAGSFVDRGNPKLVSVICDLLRGVCILIVSLLIGTDSFYIGLIVTTIVINAAKPFYRSATFAFVPAITSGETMTKYYAYLGTLVQVGQLLGVAIAGIAIAQVGNGFAFAINGVSYLLAGTAIWIARMPAIEKKQDGKKLSARVLVQDWKEMFEYFKVNPTLVAMILLCTGDYLAINFLNLSFVPIVDDRGAGNAYWLSVFDGCFAIGAMVAAAYVTKLTQRFGKRIFLLTGTLVQGILFALLAWTPQPALMAGVLMVLGAFNTFSVTLFMSSIQQASKGTVKGRVASVRHLSLTLLAAVIIPTITYSYHFAVEWGLLGSGVVCILFGLTINLFKKHLPL